MCPFSLKRLCDGKRENAYLRTQKEAQDSRVGKRNQCVEEDCFAMYYIVLLCSLGLKSNLPSIPASSISVMLDELLGVPDYLY